MSVNVDTLTKEAAVCPRVTSTAAAKLDNCNLLFAMRVTNDFSKNVTITAYRLTSIQTEPNVLVGRGTCFCSSSSSSCSVVGGVKF